MKMTKIKAPIMVLTMSIIWASAPLAHAKEAADRAPTTLDEIESIHSEISRLKALTSQAEERLKLIRAQNQITQEEKQAQRANQDDLAGPGRQVQAPPEVALISGHGNSLRAVLRFEGGYSDEVWVGKPLPGGYVVQSISSREVRLKTREGKVIVAGTAAPTPKGNAGPNGLGGPVGGTNSMTTPGAFPRGAIGNNPMPEAFANPA